MAADLITLAEYKSIHGLQAGNTRDDAQVSALLPAVSRAIRTYTGRNFEVTTGLATVRSYQYDESGMLDIDDCTAITSIVTDAGVVGQTFTLDSTQWTAMPQDDSDVYYYVLIQGGPFFGMSPEMGFQRNLDQYPMLGKSDPLLNVTATWGWPAIPDDVKLATALTINQFVNSSGGSTAEGLTSESIDGFARSWGAKQGGGTAALAIPNRARDLLSNYQRIFS